MDDITGNTNITIAYVKEMKKIMEQELLLCASSIVEKFTKNTGLSPLSVNINLIEVQHNGELQHIVRSVDTSIDFKL